VNPDVKNGLAPIRHVLRHLGQVARDQPEQLAEVYREREGTLESSVAYLEQLARNYARLTPRVDRELCDLNAVAREATAGAGDSGGRLDLMLADNLPPVRADAVVLRRILENLLGNAFDALDGDGRVLVATEPGDERTPGVKLIIADTGRGMTSEELERAFDDFYTTKPNGTGLGLSVVRRLVADVGGVLRVRTEPGAGTRFEIEFPAERGTA
jgi:signal transduction histidine kinase